MTKRRVYWTMVEQQEIVKTAAGLIRQFPRMPVFRAVAEAQTRFPPQRQRRIDNKYAVRELTKEIERELNRPVESPYEQKEIELESRNLLDAAIASAAHSVAQKFENELKAAMSRAAQRIANQAAEGNL